MAARRGPGTLLLALALAPAGAPGLLTGDDDEWFGFGQGDTRGGAADFSELALSRGAWEGTEEEGGGPDPRRDPELREKYRSGFIPIWPGDHEPPTNLNGLVTGMFGGNQDEQFGQTALSLAGTLCTPLDMTWKYFNVRRPAVMPFLVEGKNNTAVLVVPGGGGEFISWQKEGTDVAQWLNQIGISAFVLKYRVPDYAAEEKKSNSLFDAQRAMRLIRHKADEFGIDKSRVGVIGFSVGGSVALKMASSKYASYRSVDEADGEDSHADFQLLIYPFGVDNAFGRKHRGQPPTFLTSSSDDLCAPGLMVRLYAAMLEREQPNHDIRRYRHGKHGYGTCGRWTWGGDRGACSWLRHAQDWLVQFGASVPA